MKKVAAVVAGCVGAFCAQADVYCCVNTNSVGMANDGTVFNMMEHWANAAGEHPSAWSADHELRIDAAKCYWPRRLSWYPGAGATVGKMTCPSPSMEFILATGSVQHPQYVLEVDDPNDFLGVYRFDLPRMELRLTPHDSFVPQVSQLSPLGHTFVNVGAGKAKIGLVKGMKSFDAAHYGDAEARCNGTDAGAVFGDANRKNPGRVRMVINGHHHTDYVNVINDIVYFDVNSASYQYYDETHDLYPADWFRRNLNSTHAIAWNDPLSAIVTLDASGDITIDGSESTFFMGITPEMVARLGFKSSDRPTVPYIRDFEFHKRFGA